MFWMRKPFWDRIDIWCALPIGLSAIFTAALAFPWKSIPLGTTFLAICTSVIAKDRAKRIELREREDRDQREQSEREQRRAELEAIRERSESQAKRLIGGILNRLHDRYFGKEDDEKKHQHRATLFVCVEADASAGRGKHLAIFARSGVYRGSTRTWPLDDNEPTGCHGVAGKIWFDGTTRVVTAACPWPENNDPVFKARYAESLGITVEEAEALNVKSTIFTGALVIVRGRKWGVLLLDSRIQGQITNQNSKKILLNQYAQIVSAALEEIEP